MAAREAEIAELQLRLVAQEEAENGCRGPCSWAADGGARCGGGSAHECGGVMELEAM